MKLLIFIVCVLTVAGILVLLILRAGRENLPLIQKLRQAGIPLLRSHDSRELPVRVKAFLRDYKEETTRDNIHELRSANISAAADASAG